MVATTFLHEHELNRPTGDDELDELLAAAREATGENYQIVMHRSVERFGPLRLRRREVLRPQLYLEVGGVGPWQVLMCAHDRATVNAYLFGLLNGFQRASSLSEGTP